MARHWEKKPLHVKRSLPAWAARLASVHDVDVILATGKTAANDVNLVKTEGGKSVHADVPRGADGAPNVAAISQAYADGYTVVLNSLHRRWPAVAALRAALSDDLGHAINMNLYLTPAGAQGFEAHMDGHEVFVLQLDGPKRWEVFKPNYRLPLESRLADGALGKAVLSPELEAGDLLYIPRGFIHRAHTTGASSLHLTIGVQSWRWVDLLHRAVDALAEQDSSLRGTVPPAATDASLARQVRKLLGRMATASDIDAAAIATYRKELATQSVPVPGGRFAAIDRLEKIDGRTVVRRRPGIQCSLSRNGQTSALEFSDRSLDLPSSLASTLEFVAVHRSFCPDDLPGRLSGHAKLKLVRRLLRDGFLVPDDDKGPGGS
ncbi:Cupin superfamily protein [Rhodospirillales bacterium URHD0017]|nr:Cupin superfamily protein [Rhodospirillales bacterium URHD0017]